MTNFGPSGEMIYNRTYSRTKPDGSRESWPETVVRVVDGNLALTGHRHELPDERERLIDMMTSFKILPAGRHLWASGVKGRQYLFNCHVAGWADDITDHFRFTFLRLMEGGGVGANYSNKYLENYPMIEGQFNVHIVCDPEHPDYQKMRDAGILSTEYDSNWEGSFEVEDSREGWADALVDLLKTYYRQALNVNRVFDVSRVRPEGARLKTFGGRASGPAPLGVMLHEVSEVMNLHYDIGLTGIGAMEIDHAIATCVVSGGNRRSARMSIMHWNDWQIEDFLTCKADTDKHWTTNISVEVDDEFFARANAGRPDASAVLYNISLGMLANGEPGIWNSSLSNVGEPNPVVCTNPCGEIALEEWENCNLGHVNLAAFVDQYGRIDDDGLHEAHRLMTRFLIRATYGDVNDTKQAEKLARNRRIGVGHFGFASMVAMTGRRYSETPAGRRIPDLLCELGDDVDNAAREYSHDLRIPVPVKTRTVAPTGTIAKMPGVSEGIHPIFAPYFIRRIRLSTVDPDQVKTIEEYRAQGFHTEPCEYAPNTVVIEIPTKDSLMESVSDRFGEEIAEAIVESAADLSLDELLSVQRMYQTYWADNAVSFTANVDPADYTAEQIAEAIRTYGPDLKGLTVFPELSRPQSPYERITKTQYESYQTRETNDGIDEDCATGSCPVR